VNEVYLSVGGGALEDPRLPSLVRRLYEAGLRVEALMGEADWYREDRRHEMLSMIDGVALLNAQTGGKVAAIHLDIEPHQLPENKGERRWLFELVDTLRIAREHAGAYGMSTSADLPRFAFDEQGPLFAAAVQRPFVMLYELRESSVAWLARQSAAVIDDTYLGAPNGRRGRMVVAVRVEDYGEDTDAMAKSLDGAHARNGRYGGWAIHDEAKFRHVRARRGRVAPE